MQAASAGTTAGVRLPNDLLCGLEEVSAASLRGVKEMLLFSTTERLGVVDEGVAEKELELEEMECCC